MKFIVKRTSEYNDEVPPCQGCQKEDVVVILRGKWKSLDDAKKHVGKTWFFADGTFNHRVGLGGVVCEKVQTAWVINFPSMEDLMSFIYKNKQVVILTEDFNYPVIEIYDSYRE